jgi:hypothetical protein
MDHAKVPDKEPTAREQITFFSMNQKSLPTERRSVASSPNESTATKKKPELITWEELIGKR